ncbi:P-loop NTPase fold protein [Streptomyces sp. IBSBF 2394]|uniref:P-loop NTPase fold protein n=1 Tax=Streptomyces sp. IBSBF 2394 TaxID=2903532 RepID=UPI003FA68902
MSRELLDIVRGSTQPLAIGLLGPFGSGKSSVVRLLAAELKDDPKWAILHLSAERHSGSARARGLLYGLLDEAWRQDLIGLEQWKAERACLDGGRQRTAPRPTAMSAKPGKQSWYAYPAAAGAALGWLLASLATIWYQNVPGTGLRSQDRSPVTKVSRCRATAEKRNPDNYANPRPLRACGAPPRFSTPHHLPSMSSLGFSAQTRKQQSPR